MKIVETMYPISGRLIQHYIPVNKTKQADSFNITDAVPVNSFKGLGYHGKS